MNAGPGTNYPMPSGFMPIMLVIFVLSLVLNQSGILENNADRETRLQREGSVLMTPRELSVMSGLFAESGYVERVTFAKNPLRDGVLEHLIKHRDTAPTDANYLFCSTEDRIFVHELIREGAKIIPLYTRLSKDLSAQQEKFCR